MIHALGRGYHPDALGQADKWRKEVRNARAGGPVAVTEHIRHYERHVTQPADDHSEGDEQYGHHHYVPRQLGAENSDPEIGCGKQAHCPQPLQQRGQPGEAEDRLRGQGYEEDEDICGQQRQQARQGE